MLFGATLEHIAWVGFICVLGSHPGFHAPLPWEPEAQRGVSKVTQPGGSRRRTSIHGPHNCNEAMSVMMLRGRIPWLFEAGTVADSTWVTHLPYPRVQVSALFPMPASCCSAGGSRHG